MTNTVRLEPTVANGGGGGFGGFDGAGWFGEFEDIFSSFLWRRRFFSQSKRSSSSVMTSVSRQFDFEEAIFGTLKRSQIQS